MAVRSAPCTVRCACACAGLQGETRGAAGSAAGSALEGNLLRSSFEMCFPPAENLWPGELEMQVASRRGLPYFPSFLKTSVNHSIKFRSEQNYFFWPSLIFYEKLLS